MTDPSKLNLLRPFSNSSGCVTTVSHCLSTKFSLRDERKGNPQETKLLFPVHVICNPGSICNPIYNKPCALYIASSSNKRPRKSNNSQDSFKPAAKLIHRGGPS
ncbi:unnamed protein product [Fusarium langsethiae]|nr:unnamed protein product [Fusarium langsethiae]GKU12592.1 unnamed protein product [Fusarium langsethiae]